MFPHNLNKFTLISPNGKTHNQTDYILIDRRWHSIVPEVQIFRRAECDTDNYLVLAKVREEKTTFNLKKFNKVEGNEQYCAEISNRTAVLGNLNTAVELEKLSK
jgi:hypothetical protein